MAVGVSRQEGHGVEEGDCVMMGVHDDEGEDDSMVDGRNCTRKRRRWWVKDKRSI